jgi:hypothetical protein
MAVQRAGSIIAADIGNVHTRAVLIDLVDGVYRLVARGESLTTGDYPVGDVSAGLIRALTEIHGVTGRNLLDDNGKIITPEQLDRSGVDDVVITASTGRPLRTVLLGLVPDLSIASGLRAAAGTYIQILETISLDDARSEEEQLNAILSKRPDLIFITGGTENGAREPVLKLARVAQLALRLVSGAFRPTVLYAGNSVLVPQMHEMFDSLTRVFVASNVRPALDEEELEGAQLQLGLAFDAHQANRGAGFESVGAMSRLGVQPTAQSYQLVVDYLGRTTSGGVLAVDVGSAVSTLSISLNGQVDTAIRTDIGLGYSAVSLLDLLGEDRLARWLPFNVTPNQLRHYALNKTVRPGSLPETLKGLYIEHGLLRAGIQALIAAARPSWKNVPAANGEMPAIATIIGAGAALTRTGHPGFNALLLLDSVQPTGVCTLYADPYGLISALGALAHVNPEAVVQVLDGSNLERLGVVVSLSGLPAAGRTAAHVKITTEDGLIIQQDVPGGGLWAYPLGVGRNAKVEVNAAGRYKIGDRSRVRLALEGGTAGLIIDARGRPLPLALDVRGRAAQMPQWVAQMTGEPARAIAEQDLVAARDEDDASLATPPEEMPKRGRRAPRAGKPAPKPAAKGSGGLFGRRGKAQGTEADARSGRADEEPDIQSELDELRPR